MVEKVICLRRPKEVHVYRTKLEVCLTKFWYKWWTGQLDLRMLPVFSALSPSAVMKGTCFLLYLQVKGKLVRKGMLHCTLQSGNTSELRSQKFRSLYELVSWEVKGPGRVVCTRSPQTYSHRGELKTPLNSWQMRMILTQYNKLSLRIETLAVLPQPSLTLFEAVERQRLVFNNCSCEWKGPSLTALSHFRL